MPDPAPLRIIQTSQFSPWSAYGGGVQRSTHNLATALAERGHDVHVIFTCGALERIDAPASLPYGLHWAWLPALRTRPAISLRSASALSVARVARRLIGDAGRDVVVHSQAEEGAAISLLRRRASGFAFVATSRFPSLPPAVVAGQRRRLSRLKLWLTEDKYMAQARALRTADVVSTPSHWGGRLVREAFDLDPDKIRPIHNGVPAEFLDHRWEPPRDEGAPLVFFGRLAHDKGLDSIIEALARLGPRAPRVRVFGRGGEEDALRDLARRLGVAERLTWEGWADHHTLGAALSECRFAMLPSHAENFSLAVLAVLAVGAPLITTPVGGTPELVTDGQEGLLVPPADDASLAEAIGRLLADPDAAAAMASRGRVKVRTDFTWGRAAERFEALYRELLATRRGGA